MTTIPSAGKSERPFSCVRTKINACPVPGLHFRSQPFFFRVAAWLVIVTQLLPPNYQSLFAAILPDSATLALLPVANEQTASETTITPNRTIPQVKPPSLIPEFSNNPSDLEFFHAHVFSPPLIPIGGPTTAQENNDLAKAVVSFMHRERKEDVSALQAFLNAHPASPWRAAVLLQMGKIYRANGFISRALAAWEEAWQITKPFGSGAARTIGDETIGELAELDGRLGRMAEIEGILDELKARDLSGAPGMKLAAARDGLWTMKNQPEKGFMCGPAALCSIRMANGEQEPSPKILQEACSTTNGTSLTQLEKWAGQMKMHLQMAKRRPGAEIPLPAIIHWKAGHFAALVRKGEDGFLMKDPVFEQEMWISQAAVEDEGSGYFLVADGALPRGWDNVGLEEGEKVWGKGSSYTGPYIAQTCEDPNVKQCNQSDPMASYNVKAMLASLTVFDTPLRYQPPRGPAIRFQVTYDQFDVCDVSGLGFGNLGPNFTHNYLSYLITDPNSSANMDLFVRGGGKEIYSGYNATTGNYAMQQGSHTILHENNTNSFIRYMPDGGQEIFDLPMTLGGSTIVLMTKIIDPLGNTNALTFDMYYRLVAITDAIGQVTTVSYVSNSTNSSDAVWFYKISQVSDPFSRSCSFAYNTNSPYQLTSITDLIGLTSQFTYAGGCMSSMTTPYGTTTFASTNYTSSSLTNSRSLLVTDPEGGREMTVFQGLQLNSIPISEPGPTNAGFLATTNLMEYRNTFFWDKNAMNQAPGDYTKAKIFHWFHLQTPPPGITGHILESMKNPLEARVWFNYPGQTDPIVEASITNLSPSKVARVMDDGSTQLYQYEYTNIYGRMTKAVDPLGRTTLYTYSTNGIDLLQVNQVNGAGQDLLFSATYNSQHLPLTVQDAAGQTNCFGYNSYGQLIAITNALSQTVTISYDANGYLTNVLGSLPGATNSYTYDGYGRVQTSTDSSGYTLTNAYDLADRITKVTHPDGTYEQIVYQFLDPILSRDRRGLWTSTTYDALRRVRDVRDALNRLTHFEWCGCGSLASITDPMQKTTSWIRDVEGRPTIKVFPDQTQIQYAYETNSGRLTAVTDAKNQTTLYSYFADDNLQQVSYSSPLVSTPPVSYTYDTNYNRLLTMTDGIGTTTNTYYPVNGILGAGRLESVAGPWANSTVIYQYDALGRITNRAINGVGATNTFDALGRVSKVDNALGTFTNTYDGVTLRLTSVSNYNGLNSTFAYFGTTNDNRLQTIWHKNGSGNTVSKFDYTYDADGEIQTWTEQADTTSTNTFTFQYDPANQLLGTILAQTGVATNILHQYVYSYDPSGNRTGEQVDSSPTGANYNVVNELTNQVGNGMVLFAGNLNKTGVVSVAGSSAVLTNQTNFSRYVSVQNGTNRAQITAMDLNLNSAVTNYQLVVTNGNVISTLTYDLNGNLTTNASSAGTNTYEWDAQNRLTAINEAGTNRSEFTYDGLGRRVQIVERNPSSHVILSTKTFLWCATELCEERDATGTNVTKRFFGQGEQISGTNYFFTRDHLGSVREMLDGSGTIHARYDYDPYGRRSKVSGDLEADFGFTGHHYHTPSRLNLALYRAYDPNMGNWLNRDPIQEGDGLNLFDYVGNNPINAIDPFGLEGGTPSVSLKGYVGNNFFPNNIFSGGQGNAGQPAWTAYVDISTNASNSMSSMIQVTGVNHCNTNVKPGKNGPMKLPNGQQVTGAGAIQATICGTPGATFSVDLTYIITATSSAPYTIYGPSGQVIVSSYPPAPNTWSPTTVTVAGTLGTDGTATITYVPNVTGRSDEVHYAHATITISNAQYK